MSFWQETIRFGSLVVPRFMVAPLDGITDSPLRQLIRRFSPNELMFTEMRHIACVANARVSTLFYYRPEEQPLAYQISANNTLWLDQAVDKIIEAGFCMINLNMGCPARQVVKCGSGSALMANIPLFIEIITALKRRINGKIPLTIKIRAGYKERNGVEIARIAEALGIDGIIIHPRLQTGGFTAPLDYEMVAAIKKAVSIPVVFSGNINSFIRAEKVYERTGCDGFMIGRALWGCPWKMKEIVDAASGNNFSITVGQALELAQEHLRLNLEVYGPSGVHHFKKQLPQYIRGVEGASQIRQHLVRLDSADAMNNELLTLMKDDRAVLTLMA